jgi:outer membrane protein
MKKNIVLSLLFLMFATVIMADGIPKLDNDPKETKDDVGNFLLPDGFFNIDYNLGIPMGDMKDFISKNSYRGFSIDGRKFLNEHFTVGGYMGWTGFYEKRPRTTYPIENGTVTGVASTTYYNFTMGINAHYYFMPGAFIKPYLGLALGPVYHTLDVQVGRYYIQDQNWQFMMAPDLGIFIPFGPESDVGINTGIRYNLISYKNTNYGFSNGITYLQWYLGITFEY